MRYQKFLTHYDKTFLLKSNYISDVYNMTEDDIRAAQVKLLNQISYLENTYIDNQFSDEKLSLLDFSYASNIRPDIYIAELLNRVDTLKKFAFQKSYTQPIFLTLTPRSHNKPLKQVVVKNRPYKILTDNKNFTGDFWSYTRDCRLDINSQFDKLKKSRMWQKIKPIYFSTWEPYVDGSLHKHIMIFIPPYSTNEFLKTINYSLREFQFDIKFVKGDNNVDQAIAYILKYVTKTFTHSKTDEISLETLFYIKHGLRRFTTSRTLAPLFLYRLARNASYNYLDFTNLYKGGDIVWEAVKRDCGTLKPVSMVAIDGHDKTSYLYPLSSALS